MNTARTVTIEIELSEDEIDGLENLNLLNVNASIAIQKISEEFRAAVELEGNQNASN
tara:strand:- start:308 stop:478 length:171 start_codon:yes stop_codon:yes gene_type:complete